MASGCNRTFHLYSALRTMSFRFVPVQMQEVLLLLLVLVTLNSNNNNKPMIGYTSAFTTNTNTYANARRIFQRRQHQHSLLNDTARDAGVATVVSSNSTIKTSGADIPSTLLTMPLSEPEDDAWITNLDYTSIDKEVVALGQKSSRSNGTGQNNNNNNRDSQQVQQKQQQLRLLEPEDAWIANFDYTAFGKEVAALGKELRSNISDKDVKHLYKLVQWRDVAAIVGLTTLWMTPNPITIVALSIWTYASWSMIAHHTCHGGYNRVDAGRYKSRGFALGLRNRIIDWLDWMQPEAWNVEHNRLHHYSLNERKDPDLVQRNLGDLRDSELPLAAKYMKVLFILPIWKWFYYAPNTYKELRINEILNNKDIEDKQQQQHQLPKDFDREEAVTVASLFQPSKTALRQVVNPKIFFFQVLGPMFMVRYVAIPSIIGLIGGGPTLATHALVNLLAAELLTNVHAFVTIVTNHAGEDLYTFDDAVKPNTGAFYVRQIIGSTNYAYGTDLLDFSHGFLNYQIEHHVWPDLSMLQYQVGAPKLKLLCQKYGVPYTQENVFIRLKKTVDIMIGRTTMRAFPTEYEPIRDKTAKVTWFSTNGAIDEEHKK